MRALVLTDYMKLEIQDAPQPEPGPGEVLVRVEACGICGSDVHGMDGSSGRRRPPIIMGHEAAGVVVDSGKDVPKQRVGSRVTFDSTLYCGACAFCERGEINLCDARRVLGVSCNEYRQNGAFAEYVCVPERVLYDVPDGVPLEHAALVEPVSVAMHAVNRGELKPDSKAVVVGTGLIGLLVVQALRLQGCSEIWAIDIDEGRLRLARQFGATETILAEDVVGMDIDGIADVSFEVVGASSTLSTAVNAVRKGGRVVLVGNLAKTAEFPLQAAVTRELSIVGSCASAGEYSKSLELMAEKAIDVAPLISATAPLEEGAQWFERLYRREPGLLKVILQPQRNGI